MPGVPQQVIDAIENRRTNVTRRCEIYEADGVTPYDVTTKRIVTGSVSVDMTRPERRTLDITLDNRDGKLRHDPFGGFWYDKILKVYRGVTYTNPKRTPTIAVVGEGATMPQIMAQILGRLNFRSYTYYDATGGIGPDDVLTADIVIAFQQTAAWSAGFNTYLRNLWTNGKYLLTFNNRSVAADLNLWTSSYQKSANTVAWQVNPVATTDTLFTFNGYTTPGDSVTAALEWAPRVLGGLSYPLATGVESGNVYYPAVYSISAQGGKWVHYSAYVGTATDTNFLNFFYKCTQWMWVVGQTLSWETQVGEYMIDQIKEQRLPKTLQVSGRDYTKKLILDKFDGATTFVAGTSVESVVRALGYNAGLTKYSFNIPGVVLTSDLVLEGSSSFADAMKAMSEQTNIEWFFSLQGSLTTRIFNDPTTSPYGITLHSTKGSGNLVDWDKTSNDTQLYNIVQTMSSQSGDSVYVGQAENHDPLSPSRIERIGKRYMPVYQGAFDSTDQAQAFAERLLTVASLESFDLNFTSFVYPWIDAGEIAQFIDPVYASAVPSRFLLSTFTVPLDLGPATGTGKRIIIAGAYGA